jgi:topoisomerase-4 subunit B
MAEAKYSAESLQVLSGLEPVRRRPGMYTDTTRPNHLVQEVVDNSVDEALAGHAREIEVTLCEDGSIAVQDEASRTSAKTPAGSSWKCRNARDLR